jgi:Na+-transporting NADH:ubiquinone oxidoreductase subunit NqrB
MRRWWSDARHFQIVALSSLLFIDFIWIDFGAKPLYSALAILSALATQAVCSRLAGLPNIDLRSPLITGLSLSLLLRADAAWLPALAGVIAIASKFVFRLDGKHIWNPAGFAIVVLLFTQHGVWISPGQWGTSIWLAALLIFFAILVLQAAQRSDIALFFLGSHAALLVARAIWLGDPLAIPLHQLQSGSLLIFAFFMISDPRTAPDSRLGRLLFAVSVAALGHYLGFFMQMRPALYVALIALSPLTHLLDRIIPAKRFAWTPQGASRPVCPSLTRKTPPSDNPSDQGPRPLILGPGPSPWSLVCPPTLARGPLTEASELSSEVAALLAP